MSVCDVNTFTDPALRCLDEGTEAILYASEIPVDELVGRSSALLDLLQTKSVIDPLERASERELDSLAATLAHVAEELRNAMKNIDGGDRDTLEVSRHADLIGQFGFVIKNRGHGLILLSKKSQRQMLDSINNPPKPTQALLQVFQKNA